PGHAVPASSSAFSAIPPPPISTLFPYTTLFRSDRSICACIDSGLQRRLAGGRVERDELGRPLVLLGGVRRALRESRLCLDRMDEHEHADDRRGEERVSDPCQSACHGAHRFPPFRCWCLRRAATAQAT